MIEHNGHEIRPTMYGDGIVFCMTCCTNLTLEEIEAINAGRQPFARHAEDAQKSLNDTRNRNIDAANLRLANGPGPAERETEDRNARLEDEL
jgi:hypothetical protein